MKLLTDNIYVTRTNNWFAPNCEFQAKYKSILGAELMDMTSSAGDWHGFIIQKTGKDKFVAIGFSQYNNYPHAGFTLMTCEHPFYKGKLSDKNWLENVRSCWLQFDN